ncbi:MAG TPA: response regulator transcription factor [Candidatus Acidoferrales bacterium]|jgi:DNA-binding NarL/FixJ family response regulator|nr:response regulator transcription factor [Candidatus Acidoferrales bacterium]
MIPSTETYRILLADDHAVVRRGVRALLESQPGMVVCAEASDGHEAVELSKKQKPNLAILDLTMATMDGLEASSMIRKECPETQVLILTMHFSDDMARKALLLGSLGYVLKSDSEEELLAAVDEIRHFRTFISRRVALSMAKIYIRESGDTFKAPSSPSVSDRPEVVPLTDRQIDVLKLLAHGKSNKEVAHQLGISTRTAEVHRNNMMLKLNCKSFCDLLRFAIRQKLVQL